MKTHETRVKLSENHQHPEKQTADEKKQLTKQLIPTCDFVGTIIFLSA